MKMPEKHLLGRLAHLTAISLAGVTVQLAAATYYVSTTGSDSSPTGSIAEPFLTIQRGVNAAVNPGDKVFIREGVYNERVVISSSGTAANPIAVSGYQTEVVVIDGNWQLPVDPTQTPPDPDINYTPLVQVSGNYVTLSNLAVTRSRGRGVGVGGDNVLVSGLYVSFCMQAGIIMNGASGVTVENCDVTQVACVNAPLTAEYTGYGIPDVPGPQWRGSGTNWPVALMPVDSTGCVIRGNRVFKVHGEGIADLRSTHSVFEDNVCYDAYKIMFYLDNSQYSTVRRNLVYATADTTFWRGERYQTTGGPLYSGPTPSPGITLNAESYQNGQRNPTGINIYNNLIHNTGSGLNVWGGQYNAAYSDITVAYNTVVNTLTGTVGTACTGVTLFSGPATKTNIVFKNNLVRVDAGTLATGPTTGLTFSYNNWSAAVTGAFSGGSTDVIGDAHLQLGTGTPAANWFKFEGTSPCINRAQAVTGITDDYFGTARGGSPDIGAFESPISNGPTALTAIAVSSSEINLSWMDNSDVETGFEINRATDAGFATGLATETAAANAESHASSGLAPSTTYFYRVRATGTDGNSDYSNIASATTLADIVPPVIFAPADIVAEATGSGGANVDFAVTARDDVDGPVAVTASPASGSLFPLGLTTVHLSAVDAAGNSAAASFTVTVRDATAPVITGLTASPNVLQPANHKMVHVTLAATVTDAVDAAPVTRIVSVSCNEPVNGGGDGNTSADWAITGPLTLDLRAERSGNTDGRIYTITVESKDAAGNATTRTVTVTVPHDNSPNAAPTLSPITSMTSDEDAGPQTVTLNGIGDGDGSSQSLTVSAVSSNPGLIPNPSVNYTSPATTGSLSFTPVANGHGTATITVKVRDSGGTSKGGVDATTRTFTVTVNPVNDAPLATSQSASTNEDTPRLLQLSGTDIDGDTLAYTVITSPAHGSLSGAAPSLTYIPAANYNGPDSFTFKVNDDTVDSTPATVSLTVIPVNDAPVANAQSVSVIEDTSIAVTLTGSDVEGDPLAYAIVSGPAHGSLSGAAPNLTYTPAPDYNGPDSFTFKVNDGSLDSTVAAVSIAVAPVNDAPGFVKGADQTAAAGSGAKTVSGWATAISAGPANESAQALTFLVTNDNSALFSVQPVVSANGTLTFTPVASLVQAATATVNVRLQDNGGTLNGGVDTSAAQTFTIAVGSGGGSVTSLITNGGFETALGSEWSQGVATGSLLRVTTNQRTDSAALKATGTGAYAVRFQTVAVTAGQTYTISGWIRVDAPVSGNGFAVAYSWLNSSGASVKEGWMGQTTATGGSYVKKSATVVAPAGAVTLRVRCVINSTANGTAYFDDLSVTQP